MREHDGQQHLEVLGGIDRVGLPGGHDDALARGAEMLSAVDGKAAAALEHEHHCVAAGGVCTDLLALGEGEQRDADGVILGKRLADDLPGLGLDLLCKREHLLLRDVFQNSHNDPPSGRAFA